SSLVTSAGIAIAFSLSATASRRSTLREAMMTSAPSRFAISAVDRPIPDEPPTTTTFLPLSNMLFPLGLRSGRLIAGADAGLALAEPGKLPDAGTSGVDIGGDIDVDQIGLVGTDAVSDRLADIAGTIDPHAFDAAGTRHGGEIRIVALARIGIMEVGRQLPAAEIAALQSPDRGIGVVIPDHPDHREIVFHRCPQHVGVHEERAVAAHRHAGTLGCCEFRPH